MKRLLYLILLLAISFKAIAQPIYVDRIGFKLESIADIDIGWMKMYKAPAVPEAKTLGNRSYTVQQIGYSQKFMEWMQQSYMPKGCLGEVKYFQNHIPKTSPYDDFHQKKMTDILNSLPLSYGAQTKAYMFLKYDAQKKFVPQNTIGDFWSIEVNGLEFISRPVPFLCTEKDYYFVIPKYQSGKGYVPESEKKNMEFLDFHKNPNLQPYQHFVLNDGNKHKFNGYVVVLTQDNKPLPFEEVTIGEFFTLAETQLMDAYNKEQLPRIKRYGENPAKLEADLAKAKNYLTRLKEKYKNKWKEVAKLRSPYGQLGFGDFLSNPTDRDFFEHSGDKDVFPILRINKQALELCKNNKPQWIVVSWVFGMPNSSYYINMMESIMNNFNYGYLYNYFYGKDKVVEPYKPMRSPTYKATVVQETQSANAKKVTTDKSIFFFDDFSTTTTGKAANEWDGVPVNGFKAPVTALDGVDGKWLQIHGHTAWPKVKYPLPPDFEISMNILAAKDFPWGGYALKLFLFPNKSSKTQTDKQFYIKLRPGFTKAKAGNISFYNSLANDASSCAKITQKEVAAPGFTNEKPDKSIKLRLIKKGEAIEVWIDDDKIADCTNAFPAGTLFNDFRLTGGDSNNENAKYYISNFKIKSL